MQQWSIGDVTITKVVEMEATGGTRFILPQATREAVLQIPWLFPHFADADGRLKMSIHALVVETPQLRILVDTCLGNDKQGRAVPTWNNLQRTFLDDLEAAGFTRDSIDTVLCTHLHVDHVGWNTMLVDGRWVPTFERARYLLDRTEFAYWTSRADERDEQAIVYDDSVRPIVEAGLVDLVDTGHVVCDEVRLIPTVGHTPGHVSVQITSRGETALITGDFVHHPCQMAEPEWAAVVDWDAAQSTTTRRDVFASLAGTSTLMIGTHFAGASAGLVVADGSAYRLAV